MIRYCAHCKNGERIIEADYRVKGKYYNETYNRELPYNAYICTEHYDMMVSDGAQLKITEYVNASEHEHALEIIREYTGFESIDQFLRNTPTIRQSLIPEARFLQRYWNKYHTRPEAIIGGEQ